MLSIAGLGLLLWSLIEAPVRGWSSPVVIGAGVGGLVVLAVFAVWERASSHPMLNLEFFRNRRFSAAVGSVGLVTFGLFGTLFVMTQFLQFGLGYSALQAGVRVLPAAGAIAVVAPLSTVCWSASPGPSSRSRPGCWSSPRACGSCRRPRPRPPIPASCPA